MKLTPRPKLKDSDLHIRLSKSKHDTLRKICLLKNISITSLIESHITSLEQHHNI